MLFSKEINQTAWKIRKKAAKKYNCKIYDIPWIDCLRLAIMKDKKKIDVLVNRYTVFDNLQHWSKQCIKYNYRPALNVSKGMHQQILADAFDKRCEKLKSKITCMRF